MHSLLKEYTILLLMKILCNHKNIYLDTIDFVSMTSKQTDCWLPTEEFT